jgi:zinc D-Ala-D-Ala carboxypeptidase
MQGRSKRKVSHLYWLSLVIFGVCCKSEVREPQSAGQVVMTAEKFAVGVPKETNLEGETKKNTYPEAELLGKFTPTTHPDFVPIKSPFTQRQDMYLRKEVAVAFEKMWMAAQREGVYLTIVSSTRNFDRQSEIWNTKWKSLSKKRMTGPEKAKNILLYSAMPGCSRHHWGTDIDLNSLNNSDFSSGAKWNKTYTWLAANADTYGFCQVYSARSTGRATGYEEERWHWSYTPTANILLSDYLAQVTLTDLAGFEGAEHAAELDVIKNYVQGIAETCK